MSLVGADTFQWEDAYKRGIIMYRVPRNIKLNDNIVVREDEYAVFYRDGKALMYIDRPDRYALTSLNAPIVGKLVKWLSGVEQKAEVYYLQKRPFDGKFGSKQPYPFRDKDFGMVNLRMFGQFRYKVTSPELFINQFVGALSIHTANGVEDRIKEQMVTLLFDVLGELKKRGMGVADIAANLEEIEQVALAKSKDHFGLYGLAIDKLQGIYISMPEEVQKAVDSKASMTILGTDYMGYQTGQAVRDAAKNPSGGGGVVGAGVGMGAGLGMGYVMMDQMGRSAGTQQQPTMMACNKCGAPMQVGSMFCPKCGKKQVDEELKEAKAPEGAMAGMQCKCGTASPKGTKFCPECGASMTIKCPKCKTTVEADDKFCQECGENIAAIKPGVCPECGMDVGDGKFCGGCGHKMK